MVGTVEAWRIAEREKAAPALRTLHCDEVVALRGEARVEARGRVRDESCAVVSGDDGSLRMGENNHITALLLVESRRIASDGLEAPARHHLGRVWMCWCIPTTAPCPLAKLPMALILAGAWKSAEPRPLPLVLSAIWSTT